MSNAVGDKGGTTGGRKTRGVRRLSCRSRKVRRSEVREKFEVKSKVKALSHAATLHQNWCIKGTYENRGG